MRQEQEQRPKEAQQPSEQQVPPSTGETEAVKNYVDQVRGKQAQQDRRPAEGPIPHDAALTQLHPSAPRGGQASARPPSLRISHGPLTAHRRLRSAGRLQLLFISLQSLNANFHSLHVYQLDPHSTDRV